MSKDQRRNNGQAKKRRLSRSGAIGALAITIAGMGASTCTGDLDDVLFRCSETNNCRDLPGTECTEGLCICPKPGTSHCREACRPRIECSKDAGVASDAADADGAGGTGGAGGAGGAGNG